MKKKKMCVSEKSDSNAKTEELLEMITSVTRKKISNRGNLRLEALLSATFQRLDQELKRKQMSRKRRWEEMKMDLCKKFKSEHESYDVNDCSSEEMVYEEDILGLTDFFQNLKRVCTKSGNATL